ncbi:MAG: AAA family ATPase [Methyloprofundus sp.]|nr:AAA family ATPase [Methyloprofundus sp.]
MTETKDQKLHLKSIKLKGFKSIKSLDLKMRAVNILIGANGAGKSNLISLFSFLSQLSQGKLKTYIEQQGFANTFFHFGIKHTSNISIALEVGDSAYHVDFIHSANDDSLIFQEEYCRYVDSPKLWHIKGSLGESGLLLEAEVESSDVRHDTLGFMQGCRVYHFHDTSASAGFKMANDLHAADYLYKDAKNLAPFLYRLRKKFPKSYQDIVVAIQTVAPFFHDFYLQPRGNDEQKIMLKWLHKEHDEPFSANQLSDGTARFICLATLFLQPTHLRPKTIVLDEPELGLHPAALVVLAELVKSAAKESQVICSTQSISFANLFEAGDFIVVDQKKGVSTFSKPNKRDLEHWLEEYGMGDIWNKNLIGGRPEW